MRLTAAALVFLLLAACERPAKEEPAEPPARAVEVREVAAADAYGEPDESVNAVAFWSHPSVNFESLLLAATDTGLEAFNIETGERVASAGAAPASALAVFYSGDGQTAEAYAVALSGGIYEFYAIANDAPAFTPLPATNTRAGATAFCAGGGALYEAGRGRLAARDIGLSANGVSLSAARDIAPVDKIAACAVDDRAGDIIAISSDGVIRRIDPETGEVFGLAIAEGVKADASGVFLMQTAEPENAPGGAVVLLDGEAGTARLYDLIDGRALGAVRVKSTFDLDAVASARSIAVGYGNYGGVYRDGALAIVTTGDGAPIRLVPWNGVLAAIQLPLGENVDPRDPHPAAEDEGVLSIEFIEP